MAVGVPRKGEEERLIWRFGVREARRDTMGERERRQHGCGAFPKSIWLSSLWLH